MAGNQAIEKEGGRDGGTEGRREGKEEKADKWLEGQAR